MEKNSKYQSVLFDRNTYEQYKEYKNILDKVFKEPIPYVMMHRAIVEALNEDVIINIMKKYKFKQLNDLWQI